MFTQITISIFLEECIMEIYKVDKSRTVTWFTDEGPKQNKYCEESWFLEFGNDDRFQLTIRDRKSNKPSAMICLFSDKYSTKIKIQDSKTGITFVSSNAVGHETISDTKYGKLSSVVFTSIENIIKYNMWKNDLAVANALRSIGYVYESIMSIY